MNTARSNLIRKTCRSPRGAAARPRGGFTLIEVLATLLLLFITLPVIMQGMAMATHVASQGRSREDAAALAESKMNELIVTGQWNGGALQGPFTGDWAAYSWSAEVNSNWGQGVGKSSNNTLQELDVHVKWMDVGRQQELTVSTLIYPAKNTAVISGTSGGSS